jgi:TATA-binding protein-associated factor Taf7
VRRGKAAAAADEEEDEEDEEDEEEEEEDEEEEEKAATGACATKIDFLWKSQKVHEAEVCIAVLS